MNIERICKKCGCLNILNEATIKTKDVCDENKNKYKVTFYSCENCGAIHVVQVDSIETVTILREIKSILKKSLAKVAKNETVSPKQIKKREKLDKQLKNKRNELNASLEGRSLLDEENSATFIEHLTVEE